MSQSENNLQMIDVAGWYRELQNEKGLPPLTRLWGLALYQRNNLLGRRFNDEDLADVAIESILYCVKQFDERHPPKEGLCRRTVEDRFAFFFGRKLDWELKTVLR